MRGLREIATPFVAAAPAGARVRARLRVSPADESVLRAVGAHLGMLAGGDLAARCAQGRLDAEGRAVSRAARKRALTAAASSRWAGAITRTSEDQWQLAERNLRAEAASLRARATVIQTRLAVPAGGRAGRVRGYATPAERHAKALRLQALRARLARGFGLGAVTMPLMVAAYVGLDQEQIPHSSVLTRTAQQIGGSFGTAVLAVILEGAIAAQHGSLADAFHVAFCWSVGFSAAAVLLSLWLPGVQRTPPAEAAPGAQPALVASAD